MLISSAFQADRSSDDSRHMHFGAAPAWSIPVTVTVLRVIEMTLLLLAGVLVAASLTHPALRIEIGGLRLEVMIGTLATCEMLRVFGGYALPSLRTPLAHGRLMAGSILFGMLVLGACLALQGVAPHVISVWCVAWGAATASMLLSARLMAGMVLHWLGVSGRLANKVAVLGDGPAAAAVAARFLKEDSTLLKLTGRYSINKTIAMDPGLGLRAGRGDLATLLLDCRLGGIDGVVLVAPPSDAAALGKLEAALKNYAIDVYMLPEDADIAGTTARPVALGQQPMLMVIERPMKDWRALAKNGFDRLCAAIILAMIAPLLGLVAILIRIDTPGPILFRQLRVGYNNQLFPIFKFRTMHAHATDRLATTQTTRGDVRVTRVGRVLRKLSIDELPQLFNVLLGNMSLVGPRPHAPGTSAAGQRVDLLIENYARRHLVKPGITGLAQVRGFRGGMTTFEQVSRRVQCDLEYIAHQSIWLDIKIMVMTLLREVGGGRAF